MDKKFNKGKEFISEKFELPKDVVLDVPKITIIGRHEITIENHKGIIAFKDNLIKVNTKEGPINIYGKNFEILYIATSTITISGYFDSIEYER